MNIVLWIIQVPLALFYLAGGSYKVFKTDELMKVPASAMLPSGGWKALGVLEVVCAVLMIVPAATRWMPMLTPIAAAILAVETLSLAAVQATYSLQIAATNPLVWSVVMGVMAALVAYGRYALRPVA